MELNFAALCAWLALSYLLATFFESLFHEYVLDTTSSRSKVIHDLRKKWPDLWFSHVLHRTVHHYQTYQSSYSQQFDNEEQYQGVLQKLRKQFSKDDVADAVKCHFGNTFIGKGMILFALPILVCAPLPFIILPLKEAVLVSLASLLITSPYFVLSKFVHPYMHATRERIRREAPWAIRQLLLSPYGVAIRISHWVHHKDSKYNYNLFYGADLIRGRWRAPSLSEYDLMVSDGVVSEAERCNFAGRRVFLHQF